MIYFTIQQSSLAPVPELEAPRVQSNMNPMIRTQQQCLTLPNTIWDDNGCQCQEPYQGDFCREMMVTDFSLVGDVKRVSVGSSHSTGASDIDQCSQYCRDDIDCKGFIYHNNGICHLFNNEIIAHHAPGGDNNNLYIKYGHWDGSFKLENRVFLAQERHFVPGRFWEQDDTNYFAEIPLNQLKQINFTPKLLLSTARWGIFSKVPFNPDQIVPLIKQGQIPQSDSLRFSYGSLPSLTGLDSSYVYFTD